MIIPGIETLSILLLNRHWSRERYCSDSFIGTRYRKKYLVKANMLWTIIVILLVMWLLGFSFHIAGGLIHLLLVVALVVLIVNLVTGRRARNL